MISKNEIETKAKEFEIHEANVERDYVFGWLIFGIFTTSNLKDTIFLKGGNALRKGYFKNTRFRIFRQEKKFIINYPAGQKI